jgi:hypothetical protein
MKLGFFRIFNAMNLKRVELMFGRTDHFSELTGTNADLRRW